MTAHPPLSNAPLPPGSYPCSALRVHAIKREMQAAKAARGGGGYSAFRRAPRPWEELRKLAAQDEEQYWGSDASLSSSPPPSSTPSCNTATSNATAELHSQSILAAAYAQIEHGQEEFQEESDEDEEEEACCSRGRVFPPPISSPASLSLASRRGTPRLPPRLHRAVSLRAVRENGRLILQQEGTGDASPPRDLRARREPGRLRLHLCIADEESNPIDIQEEQQEEEEQNAKQLEQEYEGGENGHKSVLEALVSGHGPPYHHQLPLDLDPHTMINFPIDDPMDLDPHTIINFPIDDPMLPHTSPHDPPATTGIATNGGPPNIALDSLLKAKFHHHHHHHNMASFLQKSLTRVRPLVY